MLVLVRLAAVVMVFAVAAPLLGTVMFLAIASALSQQFSLDATLSDLAYSVLVFGPICTVAGLAFAVAAYFARPPLLAAAAGRAALGAAVMFLVFGSLFMHKLVVYGHASGILALFSALAAAAGALVAGAYPVRFLASRSQNAG